MTDLKPWTIHSMLERIEELESIIIDKPIPPVFGNPEHRERADLCYRLRFITLSDLRRYHDYLISNTNDALSQDRRFTSLREAVLAGLQKVCSPSAYKVVGELVSKWYDSEFIPAISDRTRHRFEELYDDLDLDWDYEEEQILSLDDLMKYHARAKEQIRMIIRELKGEEGMLDPGEEGVLEDLEESLRTVRPYVRGLIVSTIKEALGTTEWPKINTKEFSQEPSQEKKPPYNLRLFDAEVQETVEKPKRDPNLVETVSVYVIKAGL